MDRFNRLSSTTAIEQPQVPFARRHPQRISITLNWATYQLLLDRSDLEGRSLSNLAAHLLEVSAGC